MIEAAMILSVLNSLPVCYADRENPAKPAQMATVANAIARASRNDDDAAKLTAVGYHESRFCIAVHSGEHKGPGRGLFQLEGQSKRYPGPFVGLSQAATDNAARVANAILRRSYQCGPTVADVLTGYAGRACGKPWPTLSERVATYWMTRRRFERWRAERQTKADS